MVSDFLAALAALFATVFAIAAPGPGQEPAPVYERSAVEARIEDLRASIRALVHNTLAQAGVAPATGAGEAAPAEPPRLAPESDVPPLPDSQPSSDDNGCATEEAFGEGWARSIVRCIQRSAGSGTSSISVSSSSSVTVHETSPDDVP
jgi:hypothetical protein